MFPKCPCVKTGWSTTMTLLNILGQNYFMCYLTLCFNTLFTSFGAPVPILTHLGASFDSPEAFLLAIYNIFINMVK